jgi:hypothetical protein
VPGAFRRNSGYLKGELQPLGCNFVPQIISNYVDQQLALIVEKRVVDLIQLVGGGYCDFLGNPLANGYLMMK